jgi:type II secretory pathway pseudopilin PulG
MQRAESIRAINSTKLEVCRLRARPKQLARRRDRGAMLLAVLFMMAIMVITAMAVAPAFVQQVKRDREEEMIHRGTEYARAIKKYYKKFGRYPADLEQLENTNNLRFLRRRFKDPLEKDGKWKLLHFGDIQALVGVGGFGVPGLQPGVQGLNPQNPAATGTTGTTGTTGATGSNQGANTAPVGAQLSPQQQAAYLALQAANQGAGATAQQAGGTSPFAAGGSGGAAGQTGTLGQSSGQPGGVGGGSQPGDTTGQTGSNNTIFGNSGVGGQTFGGGAIVGVASKSKDPTIRVYNKKKRYDEWVFIYSPMLDRQNTLLRGPYNGQSIVRGQFGTPAGQLNQSNQSGFGQQPGGFGQQQPGGFGQQNQQQNQQVTPGTQFPPEQVQPQP